MFFMHHNRSVTAHTTSLENYIRSCAGYIVVTFFLGYARDVIVFAPFSLLVCICVYEFVFGLLTVVRVGWATAIWTTSW